MAPVLGAPRPWYHAAGPIKAVLLTLSLLVLAACLATSSRPPSLPGNGTTETYLELDAHSALRESDLLRRGRFDEVADHGFRRGPDVLDALYALAIPHRLTVHRGVAVREPRVLEEEILAVRVLLDGDGWQAERGRINKVIELLAAHELDHGPTRQFFEAVMKRLEGCG